MRKLIAAINMTVDGFCDHTAGIADEEIHEHYTNLLRDTDTIIWGRTTYQLMESFWPTLMKNPSGEKAMDDFAVAAENIHKIVYSRTLKSVSWNNTTLKSELDKEEIVKLKEQAGKPIGVGSPSMIVQLGNLGLIDEYQLCIQPIVLGSGLTLFKNIAERIDLTLLKTKTFGCGAVIHYYQPNR